jgi:hypothetical protein
MSKKEGEGGREGGREERSVAHSLTHSLSPNNSLTHSLTPSLTHLRGHLLGHAQKHMTQQAGALCRKDSHVSDVTLTQHILYTYMYNMAKQVSAMKNATGD